MVHEKVVRNCGKPLEYHADGTVNVLKNGRAGDAMNSERSGRDSCFLAISFSRDLRAEDGGCGKLQNKWMSHLL
jgi:hypothetical protein